MNKLKIFISSVQSEFATERQNLFQYLMSDPLFGLFFEPFIFENIPATDQRVDKVYLGEVGRCDIYLGLFGKEYGFQDTEGISPTEREYDEAGRLNKHRLIFLSNHTTEQRHPKIQALIKKAEHEVIRKKFASEVELKAGIYASLIRYLEDKELIRTSPFDASACPAATFEDIDTEKISRFLNIAKAKRAFPLSLESSVSDTLTHLNLLNSNRLTFAALLLFGKQPQRFIISSEVKCAHFHGNFVSKPIPSYQVYKGDVFQLVDQAVDFVLSKINLQVGTRDQSNEVPVEYEIPRAVVAEAIVNAVAHRDYTSTGSVQVMLFSDRLEVWNPGQLTHSLTLAKLRIRHGSFPANPLLAEPMYLAGYIERIGTGTSDMIRLSKEAHLKEPDFLLEDGFKTVLWRPATSTGQATGQASGEVTRQATRQANVEVNVEATGQGSGEVIEEVTRQATEQATGQATEQATGQATGQAAEEVPEPIKRVVLVLIDEMKRAEIQDLLGLRHRENFVLNYLNPSLESAYIEMTIPETPTHQEQRYRLTDKGIALKKKLQKSKKRK